ncbi:MAG: hypothetical protein CV087_16300 [Candidatus Brocadia sp. WS118]|nr:MAG: hypothetical protein CV087_16300 [Candidatus Brocadia sp. WS118]
MMKYYINGDGIKFVFILWCFLACGLSNCLADEKKKYEPIVHGVMIVSMNIPLLETIGNKVTVDVVIGNERTTKVTTILTVTCLTTKQLIGREAETLDGMASKRIVYSWDTSGLTEDTYTIRAELEKVPSETYLNDNARQENIFLVP